MKIYSPKEELLKVLNGEDIGYFPRAISLYTPIVDMMKATNTNLNDANYKAEPMSKLALAAHELGKFNAVQIPWGGTSELEALGCEVTLPKEGTVGYPQVKEGAFADINDLKIPKDVLERKPLKEILKGIKMLREEIDKKYNGSIPIISLVIGPFTVAASAIGSNKMFKMMIKNKEDAKRVLNIITDLIVLFGNEEIKCGGDILLVADPTTQGLSEEQFRDILLPVYRRINNEVNCAKFAHICGNTKKLLRPFLETGFNGFSFDYPIMSVEAVKEVLGNKMPIIGSVPTITHLLEGKRDDVFKKSLEMINEGVDILAASCGLPEYTPLENARAMAEAIEYYNKSKYGISF